MDYPFFFLIFNSIKIITIIVELSDNSQIGTIKKKQNKAKMDRDGGCDQFFKQLQLLSTEGQKDLWKTMFDTNTINLTMLNNAMSKVDELNLVVFGLNEEHIFKNKIIDNQDNRIREDTQRRVDMNAIHDDRIRANNRIVINQSKDIAWYKNELANCSEDLEFERRLSYERGLLEKVEGQKVKGDSEKSYTHEEMEGLQKRLMSWRELYEEVKEELEARKKEGFDNKAELKNSSLKIEKLMKKHEFEIEGKNKKLESWAIIAEENLKKSGNLLETCSL